MTFSSPISAAAERLFAGRWIAGAGISDALEAAKRIDWRGMQSIINYLGEDYTEMQSVERSVRTYSELIRRLSTSGMHSDLSVKPTQLGLLIDKDAALSNYARIASMARRNRLFTWLDMEGSEHVADTIEMYMSQLNLGHTGICIQSNLKRSEKDIPALLKSGGIVRLVKGAYSVSKSKGYQTRKETTSNYRKLMGMLFSGADEFMIATHDLELITEARHTNLAAKRRVTYAMLKGIRNKLAFELAREGESVALYVPFGEEWMSYSYRRLKEAGHLKLLLRSLFERTGV